MVLTRPWEFGALSRLLRFCVLREGSAIARHDHHSMLGFEWSRDSHLCRLVLATLRHEWDLYDLGYISLL